MSSFCFASAAIAFGSWQVTTWIKGGNKPKVTGAKASTKLSENGSAASSGAAAEGGAQAAAGAGAASSDGGAVSAESGQYTSPDMRYVSETQRHQNFFKAMAEGRVKRLDVTAVDFQPVGDPNTSYVYFIVATTDGARSDGTFVMKYEGGKWRIGAVNQLSGGLQGGTKYAVPSTFEDDLAREITELQPFLIKVAEGRLAYMVVDSVSKPGEAEAVLTGKVASKGGKVVPAQIFMHKDYELWHITSITNP